jgi:chorismate synthase
VAHDRLPRDARARERPRDREPVAAGAIAKCLLREAFGVEVFGFVRQILDARTDVAVTEDNWRA